MAVLEFAYDAVIFIGSVNIPASVENPSLECFVEETFLDLDHAADAVVLRSSMATLVISLENLPRESWKANVLVKDTITALDFANNASIFVESILILLFK